MPAEERYLSNQLQRDNDVINLAFTMKAIMRFQPLSSFKAVHKRKVGKVIFGNFLSSSNKFVSQNLDLATKELQLGKGTTRMNSL